MDPGENHHENEKKTESCAADGGLPVGMAGGRGLSARQLALADASGARAAAGDAEPDDEDGGGEGAAGGVSQPELIASKHVTIVCLLLS